jgi:hypothetical protein
MTLKNIMLEEALCSCEQQYKAFFSENGGSVEKIEIIYLFNINNGIKQVASSNSFLYGP